MRILVYGLNYAPELTGIGKYTGEMVEWLSRQPGVEIRVVTALPYYPEWKIRNEYKPNFYKLDWTSNVKTFRCPVWIPSRKGGLPRILHLLSFALSSAPVAMWQTFWRPDIIWVCAPALACSPVAVLAATLAGSKSWLHIQDYEIDVAFDMGLLKNGWLKSALLGLERKLLRSFDKVSSISAEMLNRAEDKGVPRSKMHLMPNWSAISFSVDVGAVKKIKLEIGIPDGYQVALFSGTLAAKQDLSLIPKVASLMQESHPQLIFVVCGDGPLKEQLINNSVDLKNIRFIPLRTKEELPALLLAADIHLLPQDPTVSDLVMPSKLGPMLASGRPVVSSAKKESAVGRLVAQFGLLSSPSDPQSMAEAISSLLNDEANYAECQFRAREYAQRHLNVDDILGNFLNACKEMEENA